MTKRYRFRLESVRRVRCIQEDLAKGELVQANNQVREAAALIEARVADYDRIVGTNASAPLSTAAFLAARRSHELAGQSIIAARRTKTELETLAAMRLGEYTEAAQKVKALDRLDERGREENRLENDRIEAGEVDDIVTGRFGRMSANTGGRKPADTGGRMSADTGKRGGGK